MEGSKEDGQIEHWLPETSQLYIDVSEDSHSWQLLNGGTWPLRGPEKVNHQGRLGLALQNRLASRKVGSQTFYFPVSVN